MGNPPQLPGGYQLDEPQSGAPKPPKGYVMEGAPPPVPPDQFAQDIATTEAWAQGHPVLGPVARFLVHGGQAAANTITGAPSFIYHAITAPPGPSEYSLTHEQRIAGRLAGIPQAAEALQAYTSGQVTPQGAASVLPEALGTGVGTVTGGATYGKLGEVAKATPAELNRVIPSRIRSGKGMGMLEQAYEAHPIAANKYLAETAKLQDELGTVGKQLPGPLQHVRDRIGLEGGNPDLGIPPDPFAFKEARTVLQQLNNEINFRNPTPADKIYMRAAGALADDIIESVKQPSPVARKGFFEDYQRMINETRRGNKAIRFAENLGPYAGAFAGYELGHELGAPIGAEFATGYLGRQLGKPIAGALMRAVINREGGPPNISTPPTPPSLAAPPSTTPPSLAMPPAPPPATTPPPTPPTAGVPSNMPTAASRAASDLAFSRLNPPEGVPENWGVDTTPAPRPLDTEAFARATVQARQELGPTAPKEKVIVRRDEILGGRPAVGDIGERLRQANPEPTRAQTKGKKPPPPPPKPIARNLPPEAYTRFLLQAKEGEITPGELERRFAKYGQPYRVTPLERG